MQGRSLSEAVLTSVLIFVPMFEHRFINTNNISVSKQWGIPTLIDRRCSCAARSNPTSAANVTDVAGCYPSPTSTAKSIDECRAQQRRCNLICWTRARMNRKPAGTPSSSRKADALNDAQLSKRTSAQKLAPEQRAMNLRPKQAFPLNRCAASCYHRSTLVRLSQHRTAEQRDVVHWTLLSFIATLQLTGGQYDEANATVPERRIL